MKMVEPVGFEPTQCARSARTSPTRRHRTFYHWPHRLRPLVNDKSLILWVVSFLEYLGIAGIKFSIDSSNNPMSDWNRNPIAFFGVPDNNSGAIDGSLLLCVSAPPIHPAEVV